MNESAPSRTLLAVAVEPLPLPGSACVSAVYVRDPTGMTLVHYELDGAPHAFSPEALEARLHDERAALDPVEPARLLPVRSAVHGAWYALVARPRFSELLGGTPTARQLHLVEAVTAHGLTAWFGSLHVVRSALTACAERLMGLGVEAYQRADFARAAELAGAARIAAPGLLDAIAYVLAPDAVKSALLAKIRRQRGDASLAPEALEREFRRTVAKGFSSSPYAHPLRAQFRQAGHDMRNAQENFARAPLEAMWDTRLSGMPLEFDSNLCPPARGP